MAASAPSTGRLTPAVVLTATVVVFACAVLYVSFWLRSGLRQQILQREAEALTEVAALQLTNEAAELARLGVAEVPGELLNAVLKTSKLRGVFAVRVFDADARFNGAVPLHLDEEPPGEADWNRLVALRPIARLHPDKAPGDVLGDPLAHPTRTAAEPLLETWLPLRNATSGQFAGAAQMWTDGNAIAREFAGLDRRIWTQAALAWAAGSAIIASLLAWAFRRLSAANAALRARTEDLLRANRELTLSAKTAALGAVAAHLMHELKNPVAGLEEFVATQSESGRGGSGGTELKAASELTRRLRAMIDDVVSVMRDEQSGVHFELSCTELAQIAAGKLTVMAAQRQISIQLAVQDAWPLPGRCANLAAMVLQNLLQNAVEASSPGAVVRLASAHTPSEVIFRVEDRGPGLPPPIRETLFQPSRSTKSGGTGLGLALSQQLARQCGGRLELVKSDGHGTTFQLVVRREA